MSRTTSRQGSAYGQLDDDGSSVGKHDGTEAAPEAADRYSPRTRLTTAFMLNLCSLVEGADLTALPAVFLEMNETFNATPSQLGTLAMCRGIVQSIFALPAGM